MANNTGKKYGGREAGTPNKLTAEVKEILFNIVSEEVNKLPELMDRLEPYQRAQLTIKLLQYILPKPEPKALDGQEEVEVTLNIIHCDSNFEANNNYANQ